MFSIHSIYHVQSIISNSTGPLPTAKPSSDGPNTDYQISFSIRPVDLSFYTKRVFHYHGIHLQFAAKRRHLSSNILEPYCIS